MFHTGRTLLLLLFLALAGCGTDVMSMLREESRFAWHAHETATAASELNLGLEEPLYDAELAKVMACQPVDETVTGYVGSFGKVSFGEQFKADLMRVVAFAFPVTSVEKCAMAFKTYKQEYLALSARLKEAKILSDNGE